MYGKEKADEMDCLENIPGDTMNSWVIRLMHRYSAMNFKCFQTLGVHPGQFPVLGLLSRQEGLSLREMADKLHIKPPTVTVTIQRLEKAGFVYKEADKKDQRISRIYLTENGRQLGAEIETQISKCEQTLTSGFSEAEQQRLKNYFRRMTENLINETN